MKLNRFCLSEYEYEWMKKQWQILWICSVFYYLVFLLGQWENKNKNESTNEENVFGSQNTKNK